jgi:GAF domain
VSLMIKIKPPFWKTWIFRIAIILILASLVYLFVKQRMAQVKKDKEILEKKIREGEEVIQQKIAEVEHQREEIKERDMRELEIRFMNEGIAKFSSIIVSAGNDIKKMSTGILSELVDYVGIIMGAVFVVHKAHSAEEIFLEMESSYALDREHTFTKCKPGEGYVGTCYNERKTLLITDIPKGYAKLSSGLGEIAPNFIYLIPLKYSDMVQGVIEVASIRQLEEYKVKFMEKIAENIASFISIAKAKKQTEILLEQADVQRNELQAQEEELKQNLEEMMATQEEMRRREEAWIKEKKSLRDKEAEHLKELKKLENELKDQKNKKGT